MFNASKDKVVVTGAAGNVGRKLVNHFAHDSRCERVIAVDNTPFTEEFPEAIRSKVHLVECDLLALSNESYGIFGGADIIVHLAAKNPHTDAKWCDAAASVEMTSNILLAAAECNVPRFVFASSNHVMGGYKEGCDFTRSGWLSTAIEAAPGTRWYNGKQFADSTIYASGKLMTESLIRSFTSLRPDFSAIAVRIGWVQPGENIPNTISISGDPKYGTVGEPDNEADQLTLRWFQSMWLSNRDLGNLFRSAAWATDRAWPTKMIVVNGMSDNSGMPWDIRRTCDLIGYEPVDDCFAFTDKTKLFPKIG